MWLACRHFNEVGVPVLLWEASSLQARLEHVLRLACCTLAGGPQAESQLMSAHTEPELHKQNLALGVVSGEKTVTGRGPVEL